MMEDHENLFESSEASETFINKKRSRVEEIFDLNKNINSDKKASAGSIKFVNLGNILKVEQRNNISPESHMTFNPQIKKSKDIYKEIEKQRQRERQHELFNNEYEKALNVIKTLDPDFYFKKKLDLIGERIKNSQIYHFELNKDSQIFNNEDKILKYLSFGLIGAAIFTSGVIFISTYFSDADFAQNLKIILDNIKFTHIHIVINILLVLVAVFLWKNLMELQNYHNKLIADKILKEMEDYLKSKVEEGNMLNLEEFISSYCQVNNIRKSYFRKGILKEMRILMSGFNLEEVIDNNDSSFDNTYIKIKANP